MSGSGEIQFVRTSLHFSQSSQVRGMHVPVPLVDSRCRSAFDSLPITSRTGSNTDGSDTIL